MFPEIVHLYSKVLFGPLHPLNGVRKRQQTWERVAELVNAVISGCTCGGSGEPCVPPGNRPYFRPYGSATRGQSAKIVANTFYPGCQTPGR